jgi:hypothetical protein
MLAPREAEAETETAAGGNVAGEEVAAAALLADPSAKSGSAGGETADAEESAPNMPDENPRRAGDGATMLCVLDVKSAR